MTTTYGELPRPEDLADAGITPEQWQDAISGDDWLQAIDELLTPEQIERIHDDEEQIAALARWRNGQRDGCFGTVATAVLAAIALGLCVLGIMAGWI